MADSILIVPTDSGTLVSGPPGPTVVSGDPDNAAMLGTDGLLYVAPGGLLTIDALPDVDTSTVAPEVGNSLVWDATNWVPGAGTGGGSGGVFSGSGVFRSGGDQTIPANTNTTVLFDAEEFDTDGYWAPGDPGRFTVPEDGRYLVTGSIALAALDANTDRIILLLIDGTTTRILWREDNSTPAGATGPGAQYVPFAAVVDLVAGQSFELQVKQSLATATVLGTADPRTACQVVKLGGAGAYDRPLDYAYPGEVTVSAGASLWYAPEPLTLSSARCNAGTPPTGADLVVDLLVDGSVAAQVTLPAGQNTSGVQALSVPVAAGAYLTVNVSQIGSAVGGSDLTVQLNLTR